MYDVAVIGAGIAGMATAARLRAAGLSTLVLEAHGLPGGCAGYFRRKGFAFDVGATTLVDFAPGGVGNELLETIKMPPLPGERLPGYVAWLPDRNVTLHRDAKLWAEERLRMFGDGPAYRRLWAFFDRIADVFWQASRQGVQLPVRSPGDVFRAARILGLRDLPLVRYMGWTVGDALRHYGLREDKALAGLLAMLVEDTVHGKIDDAPLINGVLGATIRGAGLTRAVGGMYGFWQRFTAHYRAMGGELRVGTTVTSFQGGAGDFVLKTNRGDFHARRVVCALPAQLTAKLGPSPIGEALAPYLRRDAHAQGGAIVVFLGVPKLKLPSNRSRITKSYTITILHLAKETICFFRFPHRGTLKALLQGIDRSWFPRIANFQRGRTSTMTNTKRAKKHWKQIARPGTPRVPVFRKKRFGA